jgi:hydrogenase nickel incorporation protein HypB
MCAHCGCDDTAAHHHHRHEHDHRHDEDAVREESRTLRIEEDLLAKNNALAEQNRDYFRRRSIAAFNFVSSPGSGKTTLIEKTLRLLSRRVPIAAIEGDQETERDAARLRAAGCPVVQINTGAVCHLDAHMVHHGLEELEPPDHSLLIIENVGNLVCPALFDLGERSRVVILSVTEGEDKPLKYPHMFRSSHTLVLSKVDLLPHVEFDVDACVSYARQVNPRLRIFALSATKGIGMDAWCDWLGSQAHLAPAQAP